MHLIQKLLKALFIDSKVGLRMLDADELFNTIPLKLPVSIWGKLQFRKIKQLSQGHTAS